MTWFSTGFLGEQATDKQRKIQADDGKVGGFLLLLFIILVLAVKIYIELS